MKKRIAVCIVILSTASAAFAWRARWDFPMEEEIQSAAIVNAKLAEAAKAMDVVIAKLREARIEARR